MKEKNEIYAKPDISEEDGMKDAKLEEKFYFHNKNIEKSNYTYRQDKDYYYIDCDYQVTENLCVQSPIIVEN